MLKLDFENSASNSKFRRNIVASKSFAVTGLTAFTKIALLSKIQEYSKKKVLFLTSSEQNALKYQNDIKHTFNIDSKILPYQDISLYESINSNKYDYANQIQILNSKSELIIAPIKSILEKFPSKDFFKKHSIRLKKGNEIEPKKIAESLVKLGYKRATMVSDIGEFSIRGDIIDIFSIDENPLRIELWGDEIVDLRYFNNENQKSIKKIEQATLKPIFKFIADEKTTKTFKNELDKESKNTLCARILEQLEEEGYFEGIEIYQSYFNQDLISVFDYLDDYIIVFDEMSEIYSKYEFLEKNYQDQLQENLKLNLNFYAPKKNHFELDEFHQFTAGFQKIGFNNFVELEAGDIVEFDTESIKAFYANFQELSEFIRKKSDHKVVIATDYPERVKELFKEEEIFDFEIIENISAGGCIINDCKVILLTDRELFNKKSKEITASKRSYFKEKQEFIESINDIQEGEFVVHNVHGVGIYKGLTQQEIDGQNKDYLTIQYSNKDKLHIPAEQINQLCRYRGSGAIKPKLSRMGGKDWANTKNKVKKEVEAVAYDLLRIYAKRKMLKGIAFEPDTPWQLEMEDAFEYTETPDQMTSIEDLKTDMEQEMPMDRLICGDVGYGKTEVAMRAIFKAVTSGYQVAFIAPTTILAMQHYQTIKERFKPFAMNVDLLCRFRTKAQQKQTIKEINSGKSDVIIATHRILQNDIKFKKLGLLVIDEEHRFGVRHKDKLKQLKENIDIISMSATPIPRTLYMSLSGIKDMSVINTPPKNRLPIKTFVGEFDEKALKNALTHELDRDGQVYYLYNRVETILEMKQKLQELLPHARIGVGHAQMDEKSLEKVMVDFEEKKYDILLSTTIIESGLDIPNANTMIIHDADRFGLAQLYQLRGRVGRCDRQAYCYCFYKPQKLLTKEATQRLKAIKEFTTLGSGYQIALRDVEIRGVGNILGTKQHGHMVNVGFDTYCQLLEETIQELKGEKVETLTPAIVDINVTAYIPDEWVGSKEQKMIEYKRLADVKTQLELDEITEEWKDRFSKPPECVNNLIQLIKIRLAATLAKISLVRETQDSIRIYLPYTQAEWKIIYKGLPRNITKYIKFTIAPKACTEGKSILLIKNSYLTFKEIFNILSDLFYYIYKISREYSK